MNMVQLEYLIASIDFGSFKEAASHMFVTPQAISKSITSLEKELGTTLFKRSGNFISPTSNAILLADLSRDLVASFKSLKNLFANPNDDVVGKFTLGVAYSPYHGGLISDLAFQTLKNLDFGFDFEVLKYPRDTCKDALSENLISAAVIAGKIDSNNIDQYKIASLHLGYLMSANNPLASKKKIMLEDICQMRIAEPINVKLVYCKLNDRFDKTKGRPSFDPVAPLRDDYLSFLSDGGVILTHENSMLLHDSNEIVFKEDAMGILPEIPYYFARTKSSSPKVSENILRALSEICDLRS